MRLKTYVLLFENVYGNMCIKVHPSLMDLRPKINTNEGDDF